MSFAIPSIPYTFMGNINSSFHFFPLTLILISEIFGFSNLLSLMKTQIFSDDTFTSFSILKGSVMIILNLFSGGVIDFYLKEWFICHLIFYPPYINQRFILKMRIRVKICLDFRFPLPLQSFLQV